MRKHQSRAAADKIADFVACNANTIYFVRNFEDRSKDPRKVQADYIAWLSDYVNGLLQEYVEKEVKG